MRNPRKYLFYSVLVLINLIALVAILKAADYAVVLLSADSKTARISDSGDTPAISTFDLYPYTGGHTQANADRDRNIWSGDHGFFVDFDLDAPPEKEPGELRLVLIGGSGAVGWGADSNFNMLYRRLERRFNDSRPCGPDTWLRVINLAMGGSQTYQNFIALNRWAHPLQPDLILSYSGHNDFFVPIDNRSDAFVGYRTPVSLVESTRFATSPDWLKDLAEIFPGFIKQTDLGMVLRLLTSDPTVKYGPAESYLAKYPPVPKGVLDPEGAKVREITEQIAAPMYAHAMASIARDFPGVPILVVSQAYMWPTDKGLDDRYGVIMPVAQYLENYSLIFGGFAALMAAQPDGRGPYRYLDFNSHYRTELLDRFDPGDGVHLSSAKAAALTDYVADDAFRILCRQAGEAAETGPAGVQAPTRPFPAASAPPPGPRILATTGDHGKELRLDGRSLLLREGPPPGTAERIRYEPDGFRVSGWAAAPAADGAVTEVLMLAEGRLAGRAAPGLPRPDLAAGGPGHEAAGWEIAVPNDGSLRGTLSFFAVMADGTARQLQVAPEFRFAADRPGG